MPLPNREDMNDEGKNIFDEVNRGRPLPNGRRRRFSSHRVPRSHGPSLGPQTRRTDIQVSTTENMKQDCQTGCSKLRF